jgi:hypothetical protein
MVSWDNAAIALEELSLVKPQQYNDVMKPEDIAWVKHHLRLCGVGVKNVVEFQPVRRTKPETCNCLAQDYCDVCQEN